MNRVLVTLSAVLLGTWSIAVMARQPAGSTLLKQERDGAPATNLTAAELGALSDPFFDLVITKEPLATRVSRIEELIQPRAEQRRTFVVDESIADPRPGQQRRTVIAFVGTNDGIVLDSNVMLSVAFSSESFPDAPRFIEAWGWDNRRGRYNYYKLDQTGTPDLRKTWKFRGSSVDADMQSAADRAGTCMQCHINGGPIMKELLFPWNNWHSDAAASNTQYLTTLAPPDVRWKVSADPHLAQGRLLGAETLELNILDSLRQFNTRRLNAHLVRSDVDGNVAVDPKDGRSRVVEGRRLLRPLFETTEVNLISARQRSGLHPLPVISTTGPGRDVEVPASFFLNANLLRGGTPAKYKGLGIDRATAFGQVVSLTPAEYKQLVTESRLELAGREPGDADFAWFTPEASHIDNDMIDQLVQRGIISSSFAAAVLAVDVEAPVFSERRGRLLQFVPETFSFQKTGAKHPDDLTRDVITRLESAKPTAGGAETELLDNLKAADPLKRLQVKVDEYFARLQASVKNERPKELRRLFSALIERRARMISDETLGALDETGDRLLPLPPLSRRPITGSGGQIIK